MLKAGFARLDITPLFGVLLAGYYEKREADGILDPLLASAVVFDNGTKRIVVMSVDIIGMDQNLMNRIRGLIGERLHMPMEAVFIACTHTHLGPETLGCNPEYVEWLVPRLADTAVVAFQDLAPASLCCTRGIAKDVAFVRRYRMKDGSVMTNPGRQNPDIVGPLGEADETTSLLIVKREGKPEIGIVNFQVHADVIGGCRMSADFPKFVRDTYEHHVPNSRCMFLNGAEGDINHVNTALTDEINQGYEWSRHMGQKIAMSVLSNYHLAQELSGEEIAFGQKSIYVKVNKGRPDQMEEAAAINKAYKEQGVEVADEVAKGKSVSRVEAVRIMRVANQPDEKEIYLTAVSVGGVVFVGFPGEPFTDVGRQVKNRSAFPFTIACCCANGDEGYYPMSRCFEEGGYEVLNAHYVMGTAEQIVENSCELVNGLAE